MPFMILLLAITTGIAMWAFFHYNPHGVPSGKLMGYNAGVLVLSAVAAFPVGYRIFAGAMSMPGKEKFAWYLGIMAGGHGVQRHRRRRRLHPQFHGVPPRQAARPAP